MHRDPRRQFLKNSAVLAAGADDVRDAIARADALTSVRGSEDFAAVSHSAPRAHRGGLLALPQVH